MNILILTGKFGMGHWSAAQSLRQQLLAGHSGMTVEVMDFPRLCPAKSFRLTI